MYEWSKDREEPLPGTGGVSVEIVDNLESDDVDKALSARQGKVLFQSVSNGKQEVAAAITDKGINASGSDTFPALANKIRLIETDQTGDATAVAGDILSGKTAYARGARLTGTITERTGNVTGQAVSRSGTIVRIRPQSGYYSGASGNNVQISDSNFVAANILSGKSIFGLAGTASASSGKKFASGTVTPSTSRSSFVLSNGGTVSLYPVTVSGLTFRPSIILVRYWMYDYTYYTDTYSTTSRNIIADSSSRISGDSVASYTINTASPAYVNTTGFCLPVRRTSAYNWYAYE